MIGNKIYFSAQEFRFRSKKKLSKKVMWSKTKPLPCWPSVSMLRMWMQDLWRWMSFFLAIIHTGQFPSCRANLSKKEPSSKSGNCAQQHAEITASQQHFGRNSSSSSPKCIIQSRSLCLTGGGNKLHREPDGMRGKVFSTRARLVSTHSPQEASFWSELRLSDVSNNVSSGKWWRSPVVSYQGSGDKQVLVLPPNGLLNPLQIWGLWLVFLISLKCY